MHSHMFALFYCPKVEGHCVVMENLYNSVRFAKACYKHLKNIIVHGVIRSGGSGVTNYVKQEWAKKNKAQAQVRGTVKADFLEGSHA